MVQIAGTYQLVKNENFVEYVIGLGIAEDKAKMFDTLKGKLTVVVDGKKVTLNSDSGAFKSSTTYILDEEIDEKMPENITLKSTAKLAGDTLTLSSKTLDNKKSENRIYKFSDTELVVTLTSADPKVPTAKRFYKRV